jgi:uncharacterized protein (UPF0264 family)
MTMENATKAVSGFVGAMKEQPLALALCVMNFALIGFVYYQSSLFNAQRADNVKLFIDVQKEVQKLLSECIVPAPQGRQQQRGTGPGESAQPTPISGGQP